MAFTVGTFLGALVQSFNSSIGWGMGSTSQLIVRLVDDPVQLAFFTPPPVGTPVYFQFYGFSFFGLFQKWEQRRGLDGNPLYEVVVVDPREILDGAQIITNNYMGGVGGVFNLFNVYGYWESFGYGASLANEGGMPWHRIRDAVNIMANSPTQGAFGGPLTFAGVSYSIDLSQLPVTPSYYRIGGGVSVSLLEAIAQVCEDAGCDFFVELAGFTIRVRTVSRFSQPPLGTISAIANTNWGGSVVRSSTGLELRNELTSAFLIGGEATTLWPTSQMSQFWGYDIFGAPITSVPWVHDFFDSKGQLIQSIPCELMNLNAAPVADILGSTTYTSTTLEMRLAQVNYSSWAAYMESARPQMAAMIGVISPFLNMAGPAAAPIRANMINDQQLAVALEDANAVLGNLHAQTMRMYEFVRGMADEYMGKKYLVALPFILAKTDSETLKATTSYEVADAGYPADGVGDFGLSPLNEDIFKTPDDRIRAFAMFSLTPGVDLTKVSPQGAIIENNTLYQEVQIDPRIVLAPNPSVVMTLNGALTMEAADNVGDNRIVAAALQMNELVGQQVMQQNSIPVRIAPPIVPPAIAVVPLKSNIITYGPWYASGAAGKVRVEHDPTLTPWNYGSYQTMNDAAACRVNTAITNMQVSEAGTLELAGTPTASVGDVLQSGGPNITNIDVQCNPGGVTTSYRFQTFTQRFGVQGKSYSDRLRRMALVGMEMRRALRSAIHMQIGAENAIAVADRTATAWMARQAKAFARATPYDTLHSYSMWDQQSLSVRQNMSLATMEESLTFANANDPFKYQQTAIMSMNGLLRPFSTNPLYAGFMATLTEPSILGIVPNKFMLNPWEKPNDVEVYCWGDSYEGAHAFRRGGDYSNARVMGLRSPLMLVGWGFDTDGKCVPGTQHGGSLWDDDAAFRQDKWKAGPLDCLWDERRGVWTVHDAVKGYLMADIASAAFGWMMVQVNQGFNYTLWVGNYSDSTIAGGTKVIANYVATDNIWYISGTGGGGGASIGQLQNGVTDGDIQPGEKGTITADDGNGGTTTLTAINNTNDPVLNGSSVIVTRPDENSDYTILSTYDNPLLYQYIIQNGMPRALTGKVVNDIPPNKMGWLNATLPVGDLALAVTNYFKDTLKKDVVAVAELVNNSLGWYVTSTEDELTKPLAKTFQGTVSEDVSPGATTTVTSNSLPFAAVNNTGKMIVKNSSVVVTQLQTPLADGSDNGTDSWSIISASMTGDDSLSLDGTLTQDIGPGNSGAMTTALGKNLTVINNSNKEIKKNASVIVAPVASDIEGYNYDWHIVSSNDGSPGDIIFGYVPSDITASALGTAYVATVTNANPPQITTDDTTVVNVFNSSADTLKVGYHLFVHEPSQGYYVPVESSTTSSGTPAGAYVRVTDVAPAMFYGGRKVDDASIASGSYQLTSQKAAFTAADKGSALQGNGILANTTIASVTDNQTIQMSQAANQTLSNNNVSIVNIQKLAYRAVEVQWTQDYWKDLNNCWLISGNSPDPNYALSGHQNFPLDTSTHFWCGEAVASDIDGLPVYYWDEEPAAFFDSVDQTQGVLAGSCVQYGPRGSPQVTMGGDYVLFGVVSEDGTQVTAGQVYVAPLANSTQVQPQAFGGDTGTDGIGNQFVNGINVSIGSGGQTFFSGGSDW